MKYIVAAEKETGTLIVLDSRDTSHGFGLFDATRINLF